MQEYNKEASSPRNREDDSYTEISRLQWFYFSSGTCVTLGQLLIKNI